MSVDQRVELLPAVMRAVAATASQHAAFSQALAAQLGIGATDLDCLLLLRQLGPATAGQLAETLSLTTGAMTGVVDRLVAAGFVVRDSDPADRRRVIVRLVPQRVAALDAAFQPLIEAADGSLTSYSDADLRLVLGFERRAAELIQQQTTRLKAEFSEANATPTFTAQLGPGVDAGHLEFGTGASALRVSADNATDNRGELYVAFFDGPQPSVRVQGGTVTFRYKRMSLFDWTKHSGSVVLNPTIPWSITVRSGASKVVIDARELRLSGLLIEGGASKVEMLLGAPVGSVPICVDGGVNQVQIRRPGGVPSELQVSGGANRLVFDEQRFGAVGGSLRLASRGWELTNDRYQVQVRGGASRLEIHEE